MKKSHAALSVLILALVGFALTWVHTVHFRQKARPESGAIDARAPRAQASSRVEESRPRAERRIGRVGARRAEPRNPEIWDQFLRQEGGDLRAEWGEDGRLISVEAKVSPPNSVARVSNNASLAKERALEVVRRAGPLLSSAPLGAPIVQTDEVVAKVYFRQELDGLLMMPTLSVVVTLGQGGEILRIDNATIAEPRLENSVKLSAQDASRIALEAARANSMLSPPALVAWNMGDGVAKRAWSVQAGGRSVVVDAQTGEILSSLDRRMR